jgi:hypothetical protein
MDYWRKPLGVRRAYIAGCFGQVHYRINDFAVSSPLQGITIERVANSDAIAEVFQKLFGGNQ